MKIYLKKKNNKYIIIKEGAKRASKSFDSYAEARSYAEKTASDLKATLVDEANPIATSVKKAVKKPKARKIIIILAIIIFIALVVVIILNKDKIIKPNEPTPSTNPTISSTLPNNSSSSLPSSSSATSSSSTSTDGENVIYDDFQIHFMMLGNDAAGDSVYIKAGDTDILIDAGSNGSSAPTLISYINQYCTDGKLEYVIATHGHTDHIASFAGNTDAKATNFKGEAVGKTGIMYYYAIDTFIDFSYMSAKKISATREETLENKSQVSSDFSSSTLYGKYLAAREYAISKGTKYYTAKECFNNEGDAKSTYTLAPGITMDILYNYYYFNTSSDLNNYSVCTMFNYNEHHFMLTGDLEVEGEEKLASYYDSSTDAKTLPHVDLFKAGHHGSPTSSNDVLLSKITPDICAVCCCAGTAEYTPDVDNQFPSQEFINRIAKYTDRVYVTTMLEYIDSKWTFTAMNGNIIVSSNGANVGVSATNNLTKLKDTTWFNETIYVKNGKNVDKKKSTDFYTKDTPDVTERPRRIWPN